MLQREFVDLREIVTSKISFYAHRDREESRPKETLLEHTKRCEKYYTKILEEKNMDAILCRLYKDMFGEDASYDLFQKIIDNVITFHDIGKINPRFQKEKMLSDEAGEEDFGKGSEHSIYSSILYTIYFVDLVNKEITDSKKCEMLKLVFAMSYVISRHHSPMVDFLKNGESFIAHFEEESNEPYYKIWKRFLQKKELFSGVFLEGIEQKMELVEDWSFELENYTQNNRALFLLMRLMYSMLVAADFYATTEYMEDRELEFRKANIGDFKKVYEQSTLVKQIRKQEKEDLSYNDDDMNAIRTKIFLDVEKEYLIEADKNIFFFESPTGSGKSNTAMNLSFQMLKGDRNKIIYAYPFNTLVEQNKKTIETLYKGSDVLSQIAILSSVVEEFTDETKDYVKDYTKALLERQFIEHPFVITTNVTLFHILFGSARNDLFGFYQMANSVIVLDEIQAYRSSVWFDMIHSLDYYAEILNIKWILMSATLPDLSFFLPEGSKDKIGYLIKNSREIFQNPIFKDRVHIKYDMLQSKFIRDEKNNIPEELVLEVINKSKGYGKILVEFIYKKSAEDFYRRIQDLEELSEYEICIITGDDNIYDRNIVIEKVMKPGHKIILVSTQVVEAGVDIDMDIGFKDISLFENEEQFLGRINRSGKREGWAYFFDLDDEKAIYRNDITSYSTLREQTRRKDLLDKCFFNYYEEKLKALKRNAEKNNGKTEYIQHVNALNFESAARCMELIDHKAKKRSIFFNRTINRDNKIIHGSELWKQYKELVLDTSLSYAEKTIRLGHLRKEMNQFIYEIRPETDICPQDYMGALEYIENGDDYFKDGRLDIKTLEDGVLFL